VLAEDYRIITFDPRGLGGSDRPWDFYSVEMTAHDLHRLAVEQSLRDITLVAWSGAALAALLYARDHRDRVARVVLVAPLIPLWLAAPDAETRYDLEPILDAAAQQAWTEQLLDDRAGLFDRLVDHITHHPLSGPRRQWLWQRLMHGAPHAQRKNWEALCAYDPADLLPEVQAPVTIISAEHDRFSPPALSARLAELLPRAQCVTVSDCGHAVFLEQRDAVVTAVRDLVSSYSFEPEEPSPEDAEETVTDVDSTSDQPADPAGAAPGEPLPTSE
jgi:pimeloyl-ACP methyl ester carboxylesterase